MLDAVEQDGQPRETAWPYMSAVPRPPIVWTPPSDVGELFNASSTRTSSGLKEVRAAIDLGEPTVVVLQLSDAFYFGPDGDGVIDSTEAPDPTRVHAVVAVAHGVRGTGGVTLVRNSWGAGWGVFGHAWLTDQYLGPRIVEIATMTKAN
jgi:hypothetical protein